MSLKLTAASFLNGVKQSGLVEPERLVALLRDIQQSGVDGNDSAALAAALVERGALTAWQSEKLLQGRHKGFILGRYALLSLLGAGEMSAVFLAQHVVMERRCAIKVLPGNKVRDTSYLARFYREARAVASLDHPNIVAAFDVDKQLDGAAEIHFLVMEYVDGKSLEKLVGERGKLGIVEAVDLVRQAAEGLGHAHQAGLVHRDVKPQNVLVTNAGVVKLLDLGLARFFRDGDEESLTIKHDEKVLGTADYLAPEQAVDSHNVDARADIYSLGCTLYFALTGHPPFTDGTLVQRLLAHQTKLPPSVRIDRPEVPDSLVAILEKMMAKKPQDRYQQAQEVAEALARWLLEQAPAEWLREHLALFATLGGLEAIQAAQKRLMPPAEPAAVPVVNAVAPVAAEPPAAEPVPAAVAPTAATPPSTGPVPAATESPSDKSVPVAIPKTRRPVPRRRVPAEAVRSPVPAATAVAEPTAIKRNGSATVAGEVRRQPPSAPAARPGLRDATPARDVRPSVPAQPVSVRESRPAPVAAARAAKKLSFSLSRLPLRRGVGEWNWSVVAGLVAAVMLIMTGVAFVSAGFGGSDLSNRPATNAQPVTRDVVANEPAPTPLVE